jgi:TRAP-type mannitol/chloroaromatic compound transport system substrate-binding protein
LRQHRHADGRLLPQGDQEPRRHERPEVPHRRLRRRDAPAHRRVGAEHSGGEIYTSLEKGTIDAAEFIGPYDDEKLGLHKIAKFYHYPSFWDGCGQISMYVGSKAWAALPKEYQAIFETACAEAHVDMQAKYDARNPQALKRLVAAGVQLRPFPKAMADAALTAAEELFAELSGKNEAWKKIFTSCDRFRRDAIMWSRFSDGAFDSCMATTLNRKTST